MDREKQSQEFKTMIAKMKILLKNKVEHFVGFDYL